MSYNNLFETEKQALAAQSFSQLIGTELKEII